MNASGEPDPAGVALELVRALGRAGMRCAIGGSIALGLWGVPRGTKDADLNVFVPPERHGELLDVLVAAGCTAPVGAPWTLAGRATFVRQADEGDAAVVWKDGFRVDVFVPSIPFYDEAGGGVVPFRGQCPGTRASSGGFLAGEGRCSPSSGAKQRCAYVEARSPGGPGELS